MSRPSCIALLLGLGVAWPGTAAADDLDLRVDVEPMAYVLRGYSAHLKATTPGARRLIVGVGAYGFDVPAMMVELASGNRDEDWEVRLRLGYGVSADWFFGARPDQGWLVGGQLGLQHYRAASIAAGGPPARFTSLVAQARVGYEWHPWPRGFYLFPWLGLAASTTIAGDTRVGTDEYDTLPVLPYGAVELGWRF